MAEITAGARFNQWIDRYRKKKYDVAEQLGVTPGALSRWLSGKGLPSPTARILIEVYTQAIGGIDYLPRDIWGK